MTWPDRRAWVFSAKTFAAAILALYVSLRLGLPRPFWAMSTCYIVAQPWSGMARAKGLYRLLGTLAGAAIAVALVPNLVNAPPLLAAAMALWVGLCLTASLLMPSPQNYACLLAGYTAAIIGFPAVDQPAVIFDTAVARGLEIGTGILCVLLVETLLPVRAAPAVLQHMDKMLADLARLARDVLAGKRDLRSLRAERRAVAQEHLALAGLVAHLPYEPPSGLNLRVWVPLLHQRIRVLPLLLASLADRAAALRASDPAKLAQLAPVLAMTGAWMDAAVRAPAAALADSEPVLSAIARAAATGDANDWSGLLRAGLLDRLRALVLAWRDSLTARLAIGGKSQPGPADRLAAKGWPPAHADVLAAVCNGLGLVLAIVLVCAFWIATGWPDGAAAATWVAIGGAIAASQADPDRAAGTFMLGTLLALALACLYLFAILPAVTTGLVPLVLALAVIFLPAGAAQVMPALAGWALPLNLVLATNLALSAHFDADFGAFANGALASLVGLLAAQLALAVSRPAGIAWQVARLRRADRAALAAVAGGASGAPAADVLAPMLDRLDAVAARLPADAPDDSINLIGLRLALSVLELRALRPALAARVGLRVDRVLRHVARHMAQDPDAAPGDMLRAAVDTALAACMTAGERRCALALTGLRRVLLPAAPPPALPCPILELAA